MAATQAEKQQNDVNCEKVQPDQHLNVRNSLLQNGTDKSGVRGGGGVVAVTKSKNTGGKNLVTDSMSQYRQDGNGGGGGAIVGGPTTMSGPNAGNPTNPSGAPPTTSNVVVTSDSQGGGGGAGGPGPGPGADPTVDSGPGSNIGPTGPQGPDTNIVYPVEGPPTTAVVSDGHGGYGGYPSPYGRDVVHNSSGSADGSGGGGGGGAPNSGASLHAFGPRPAFCGSPKQMPGGPPFVQHPQQRFVSGQALSQPTGPTPTLNQLLQSSNPMPPHRYQNSYGHPDQPYNQGWPPQKSLGSYGAPPAPGQGVPPAPYRNQPTLSPAYGGGLASSPGYGESRSSWPAAPMSGQHGPGSPGPPNTSTPASQPSPQPPSHSPGPGLPPSPQHQQPPQQTQQQQQHQGGFPNRPAQPTTPNAHAPDAADLSGGNSNDSSGGPAPGTPNSQGMRPTPSPTGSTGSRSMSPAVGQQNIPMPPRPSSGQSDGGGPTRMSHSPMATQGSYQGPHPSVHGGYKGHPGMVGGPPGQQMPLYQPNQQYSQSGYPPRPPPQANLQYPGGGGGYGPPPSSQAGGPPPLPPNNNMSPQQYPNRSSNHMSNSQFQPYQQPWQQQGPVTIGGGLNKQGGGNNMPPQQQQQQQQQQQPPQSQQQQQQQQPQPGSPSQGQPGPPRPPHYLKQHLQHKMGFGNIPPGSAPPSQSPPQNYHMGPPPTGHPPHPSHPHSGMGPPPTMGPPPNMPPSSSPLMPNHQHDGPMPPPSSTPNSHSQMANEMMDNGITTTAQGGMSTHVTTASGGSVTSVVTTGPDGTPIDEGSQQSTLSNASAASGEDPQCTTPKSNRKNEMGHYSHPTTPQSTVPSPGAASINSVHEDYGELSSPSWPRTPASPVFNSHVPPPDTYRSKKTDSLGKLYEMDDSPDRRAWLDKLLAYMEERRTPITTCPTISKNPLDLFRLYVYVKDRGGFMEVTKNKTWKDIAGMLGIGASSSAAYTLRKHYTKNLLAYECQFDRGGIDPQPIINQVEASSKKKGAKAASVPSPGSSNSQDSFPPPSSGQSMDGYGYGYPPGNNPEYNAPQRPSSQSNAPSPHGGSGGANHLNNAASGGPSPAGGAADNVSVSNPFDDVSPSPPPPRGGPFPGGPHPPYPSGSTPRPPQSGGGYSGQTPYNQYPNPGGPGGPPDQYSSYSPNSAYPPPAGRPVYPPYSGAGPAGGVVGNVADTAGAGAPPPPPNPSNPQPPPSGPPPPPTGPSGQDPYNRYLPPGAPPTGGGYTPRPTYSAPPGSNQGPPTPQQPPAGPYNQPQDYYRPDQNYPNQQGAAAATGNYPGGPPSNKTMPPPGPQPPRRHPDFAKEQQPYQFAQQRPQIYAWSNRPPQYGNQGLNQGPQVGQQPWQQGGGRPPGQWDRYPPGANQGYQPQPSGQQNWTSLSSPGGGVVGQTSPLRPPLGGPRPGKPFSPMMLGKGGSPTQAPVASSSYSHNQLPKREITFPPDSVEATLPVLYRRKRLCRADLGQVDAWRIIMCLRSGLLSESTYALDILNVLLFDDSSVAYFGLSQWPGLLDILLEHFQRALSDIFDGPFPREDQPDERDVDLGGVTKSLDPNLKSILLNNTNNYTFVTRKGYPVKVVEKNDEIFIRDHEKDWDVRGDTNGATIKADLATDPWELRADHILPTFQAEFGRIPFHRYIESDKCGKKKKTAISCEQHNNNNNNHHDIDHQQKEEHLNNNNDANIDNNSNQQGGIVAAAIVTVATAATTTTTTTTTLNATIAPISDETPPPAKSGSDKNKRRTKTLSDVISRIKKDTTTTTTTTTQVATAAATTNEANGVVINTDTTTATSTTIIDKQQQQQQQIKTDVVVSEKLNCEDGQQSGGVVDLNATSVNGECGTNNNNNVNNNSNSNNMNNDKNNLVDGKGPKVRDNSNSGALKRRRSSDYEDEAYTRDEASLVLITESQDNIGKRCVCISNILRSLTFIPGNEGEFARSSTFLAIVGKLLLLHHEHPPRTQKTRNYDREEDADFADSCSSLQGENEWWWDFLIYIRENILVSIANISGQIDFNVYPEEIVRPILDGLLHWAICPSATGQDPFASVGPSSLLSPQRLALESLCKLCVTNNNVDLVIATPPFSRLERLCAVLTKHLCRSEDQVLREFSINLLHYLAAADSCMARTVASQTPCVSLLVAFIEQAEQSALGVANQHGIGALRDNPDSMGTSLDMLRRAAATLVFLARHPDNKPLLVQQESRLLALVMSQILDQQVALLLSKVLFQISRS